MTVVEQLDAFREGLSGCDIAVLVDLSTTMVLSKSTGGRVPQEELDALAEAAREVLEGPMSEAALGSDGEAPEEALGGLVATGAETRAFLRGAPGRHEALVCVCTPDADVGAVFEGGRAALAGIMADG